jgi:LAO/AO transport system kinase
MLQLSREREWTIPIVQTVATEGNGVSVLVDRVEEHRAYLERSGAWHQRRAESARRQVRAIVEDRVERRFEALTSQSEWEGRFAAIATRDQDPYSVADDVLRELGRNG